MTQPTQTQPTQAIQQLIHRNSAAVGAVENDEWRQPALRDPLHAYAAALRAAARALDDGDVATFGADPVAASAPPVVRLREVGRLSAHVRGLVRATGTSRSLTADEELADLHTAGAALAHAVADSRHVDRPVALDTAAPPAAVRRVVSAGALTRVLARCAAWSPAGH